MTNKMIQVKPVSVWRCIGRKENGFTKVIFPYNPGYVEKIKSIVKRNLFFSTYGGVSKAVEEQIERMER